MTHISDYYPREICEWIALLPKKEDATEQQKRLIDLVEDQTVGKKAKRVLDKLLAQEEITPSRANELLENFWVFLEDASGLPDLRPRGARTFNPGKDAGFFTPAEIRQEFDVLKGHCAGLVKHLELRREVIFWEKLDPLITLLTEFGKSEHLNDPNNPAFPQIGRAAGGNNWRNEMLQGLFMRAEMRLGERFPTLCREIHRVLMALESLVDERTARDLQGLKATRLLTPI